MLRRLSPLVLSAAFGLAGYFFVLPHLLTNGWAAYMKMTGKAAQCSWANTLTFYSSLDKFDKLYAKYRDGLKAVEVDEAANLERLEAPGARSFWAQRITTPVRGFGWLLAEHQWMREANPETHVRKGDVVVDCGAHIGVFTWKALEAGAAKVVAVEPDPANLECLRRNFKKEIADGRVVLAGVGVWSKPGKMTLNLGNGGNTGVNSMVEKESEKSIEVPVTTLDQLVKDLGLGKVNFVKMDIEGAEREALVGAMETLKKDRPRLMLDLNHRADDSTALPAVIRRAHADYRAICGPCQMNEHGIAELMPHVIYFE
ncbi:MAG: FkbM family methyltransferase [Bryobacterales bacterium]|nr:FkbM family methyltransferase [Bryobacterales bacterium]